MNNSSSSNVYIVPSTNINNGPTMNIIKTDENTTTGIVLMYTLFGIYLAILIYYAFKKDISMEINHGGVHEKGISEILEDIDKIPMKKAFLYIIIAFVFIYALYTLYLMVTVRLTSALKTSRFWDETFFVSFAFSFALLIPGFYINRKPNFILSLVVFIFGVLVNIIFEVSGFYNTLYSSDPDNLQCRSTDDIIDINKCISDPINNRPITKTDVVYKYMFVALLVATVICSVIPNLLQLKSSVSEGEPFYFWDVLFLGLTNGILVLLSIQYMNIRRAGYLLPSTESAIIILKFVIFHLSFRFSGFL